ncbi:MAG: hypothetical protein AAGH70_10190 [Pseudomonadota bacterium]
MVRLISVFSVAAMLLGGCSSNWNPINWFGSDPAPGPIDPAEIEPLVPENTAVRLVEQRPLIQQVTQVEVLPADGGVLVRASGIASAAGAYSAQLTTAAAADGSVTLDFRAFQGGGSGDGTVTSARFISDEELGGTRTINVRGATNVLSARR